MGGVGWHGAGLDAADIDVVTACSDEADALALDEDGSHDGDVGQVAAASVGVVAGPRLSGRKLRTTVGDEVAHGDAHRAEMDRDVGGVGDESAVGIKHRTGEVVALSDAHRACQPGQSLPHALGDGLDARTKDGGVYGVEVVGGRPGTSVDVGELQEARVTGGLPSLTEHDGGALGLDERRTLQGGDEAGVNQRHHAPALKPRRDAAGLLRADLRIRQGAEDFAIIGLHRDANLNRLDGLTGALESEPGLVGRHEGRATIRTGQGDLNALGGADVSHGQSCPDSSGKRQRGVGGIEGRVDVSADDRHDLLGTLAGESDAHCGEHPRQCGHQHRVHGQTLGNSAGMPRSSPAKGPQRVCGGIHPHGGGELVSGLGHDLGGYRLEAGGDFLHGPARIQRRESRPSRFDIERTGSVWSTHRREVWQSSEHRLTVRHRCRATASVSGGSGIRARAPRTHTASSPLDGQQAAPAGCDGLEADCRGAQRPVADPHRCHPLRLARHPTDIGAGPAHVQSKRRLNTGHATQRRRGHHSACRSGEHRVSAPPGAATVAIFCRQSAVGAHVEPGGARQQRGEGGIGEGGAQPGEEATRGCDLMAQRDGLKARSLTAPPDPPFFFGGQRTVQQHYRHSDHSPMTPRFQLRCIHRCGLQHRSIGGDASAHRNHPTLQGRRALDVEVKQRRTGLITDGGEVGEAGVGQQDGRCPLPLQQRVGGHSGATTNRHIPGEG